MQIEILEIDLTAINFNVYDIYTQLAPFLKNHFLAKIEVDGISQPLDEIEVVDARNTLDVLQRYAPHGSHCETLVAYSEKSNLNNWAIPSELPSMLGSEEVNIIRTLMHKNGWGHYICLAQTQILIATEDHALSEWIRQEYELT